MTPRPRPRYVVTCSLGPRQCRDFAINVVEFLDAKGQTETAWLRCARHTPPASARVRIQPIDRKGS
jgi:hypothetical protein